MSSDEITLVRRRSFSVVPDDILLDKRMSLRARLVLGWMVGRPEGWIFSVRQMQMALGMTETVALLVMVFTIVFLGRLAGS